MDILNASVLSACGLVEGQESNQRSPLIAFKATGVGVVPPTQASSHCYRQIGIMIRNSLRIFLSFDQQGGLAF